MKVSIYLKNDFGAIVKREATLVYAKHGKYAQYNNAALLSYRLKRKRHNSAIAVTYMPYVVIAEGWDLPDPADMFDKVGVINGVTIKKSSYSSFDARFCTDFDEIVDSGKLGNIVFDFRHTKGASPY